MKQFAHLFVICFMFSAVAHGKPSSHVAEQSLASFTAALDNDSMSQSFVLVTVENLITGETRTICVAAPFLLGALHMEYKLPYSEQGIAEAKRLALDSRRKSFRFSDPKAVRNVWPAYSALDVEYVREELADVSTKDLKHLFRNLGNFIAFDQHFYLPVAHVLLERGLRPYREHRTNLLRVE